MIEKTIILSALNGGNQKAVLNIEQKQDGHFGNLRLYNFEEEPSGILTLAFLIEKEVYKTALLPNKKNLFSFNLDLDKELFDFSCALVLIQNGTPTPLLLGSTTKNTGDISFALSNGFSLLDKPNLTASETEQFLDENQIDFEENEKQEINKAIENEFLSADKCASCNYRNAFYGCTKNDEKCQQINFLEKENSFQKEKEFSELNFYDEIKGQIELLFERYPEETFLCEIIPNSKWVKVDYEDNGKYFVVGLLYENEKVAYVCYGMPGEYTIEPPREFASLSQWLPLDPEKPNELGYWLMYQDADTGENVEIKIS